MNGVAARSGYLSITISESIYLDHDSDGNEKS